VISQSGSARKRPITGAPQARMPMQATEMRSFGAAAREGCPAASYITGTADPLNLIEGGVPKRGTGASEKVRAKPKPPVRDSILKWAKAVGCPSAPKTTSEVNGVPTDTFGPGCDGLEVVYITVEGLGHTWAGGKSLLPEFLVGKRSDRIKATDVIWEFFQMHANTQAGATGMSPLLETAKESSPKR
jgi:polyhydroxybutyrate depolymerase